MLNKLFESESDISETLSLSKLPSHSDHAAL